MTGTTHYTSMDVARQLVSVLVVLALVVGFAWFMRRQTGFIRPRLFGSRQSVIRVLQRVALTPQHSLHIVSLGDCTVILGAGPNGITILRELGTQRADAPGQRGSV